MDGKPLSRAAIEAAVEMAARGVYPSRGESVALSAGWYSDFGDFANIMQVLEHVWPGNGERAKKLLQVGGVPSGKVAEVSVGKSGLVFEDIIPRRAHG